MKSGKKTKPLLETLNHRDMPATNGLVTEVRNELLAKMSEHDHKFAELGHKIDSLDHKVNSLDHKIDSLDHKVDSVDHRLSGEIQKLSGKIENLTASVHRSQALMEEQRSENRVVLDGIKLLMQRQDRTDADLKDMSKTLNWLARAKAAPAN
jgi:chromosome segregation ATPase